MDDGEVCAVYWAAGPAPRQRWGLGWPAARAGRTASWRGARGRAAHSGARTCRSPAHRSPLRHGQDGMHCRYAGAAVVRRVACNAPPGNASGHGSWTTRSCATELAARCRCPPCTRLHGMRQVLVRCCYTSVLRHVPHSSASPPATSQYWVLPDMLDKLHGW